MRILIALLLTSCAFSQYTPPSGGGGGGSAPSGSLNSVQTYATSSSLGNAGFAAANGQTAFGNVALVTDWMFNYDQSLADISGFSDFMMSQHVNRYTGLTAFDIINGMDFSPLVDNAAGNLVYGVGCFPRYRASGTLIELDACRAQVSVGVGATATNAYGMHILAPSNAGTITNSWGLRIEDQPGTALQTGTGLVAFGGRTNAPAFMASGSTFTASGCGNGTLVGGATAGKFTSGDAGGSCSIVVTMGSSATAATGWACHAQDLTAPAKIWGQTSSNATTATFLSPAVTTSGDVISLYCVGY